MKCSSGFDDTDDGRARPGADDQQALPPIMVRGALRIGPRTDTRDRFKVHQDPDLRILLEDGSVGADAVIEWGSDATLSVVDADTHHWQTPPSRDELQAHLAAVHPQPAAAWISHGCGLKLVYVGPAHHERALAAAFSLPTAFHVELLNCTRHPASTSEKHPGRHCGAVVFGDSCTDDRFEFRAIGRHTPELRRACPNFREMA